MKTLWQNKTLARWLCAAAALLTAWAAARYKWLEGFRFFALMAVVGLWWLYLRVLPLLAGRRGAVALGGGGLLALGQAIGDVMAAVRPMREILLVLPGYGCLFVAVVAALLAAVDALHGQGPWARKAGAPAGQNPAPAPPATTKARPGGRFSRGLAVLLGGSRRATLCRWGLFLLCWLPYLILFWPGAATPDTYYQLSQGLGFTVYTSHHPPALSALWGLCMQLGHAVFGHHAAGVAIISLLQMAGLALVLAACLGYMARRGVHRGFLVFALLFFALFPGFGWFSVTLWKDVYVAAFAVLLQMCVFQLVDKRAAFFASPGWVALLGGASLGLMLAKNVGIYMLVLAGAALVAALAGCRRQLLCWLLCCVAAFGIIEGPVYSVLGVQKGDMREALSVPLLQMALVVREAEADIAPADSERLARLFPGVEDLGQRYNHIISDDIKFSFDTAEFKSDLSGYLGLYVRLGLLRPALYVRAALEHMAGYFFPDTTVGIFAVTPYAGMPELPEETMPPASAAVQFIQTNIGHERITPGVSMLFSIGFWFWCLLFCGMYLVYKRRFLPLVCLGPLFVLWLTCITSPVYAMFRYGLAAVYAAPLIMSMLLGRPNSAGPPPPKR